MGGGLRVKRNTVTTDGMSAHGGARHGQQKNPGRLIFRGSYHGTVRDVLLVWWRRRESNPRPKVLYSEIYILSQAN